jgi:hypothetical protein
MSKILAAAVLLGALAIAACSSAPTITGSAVFTHPGEGEMTVRAPGSVVLTFRNAGPGVVEIEERYGEDGRQRSRRFGPGTRLLRRFHGEARILFRSVVGPRSTIEYRVEGNSTVIVTGAADDPPGDAPVKVKSWSQHQVEER